MASVNAGHYVLGTEGLALLRTWMQGDTAALARRVEELSGFLAGRDAGPMAIRFDAPALDVEAGYARWSASYDAGPNPLIRAEEPVVRRMIDDVPTGVALDAACGTGRHTAYLRERGHRVIGVDTTPEMLALARARVPDADLRPGRLETLPLDDASVDVAVCALALMHVPDVGIAITELARVVRPGGRLILSDLHPAMQVLGGSAFFVRPDGQAGNVRSHHHTHGRYLAAFRSAGLAVRDCVEPPLEEEDLAALSGGLSELAAEAFRAAWVGVPEALVWECVRQA